MQKQNTLLVEIPTNLGALFHDDPIVAKYRHILGQLVAAQFLACKSDLKPILARKEQIHRQIRGRQISLLKAGKTVPQVYGTEKQHIDDATLRQFFPYVNIVP